MKKYLKEAEEFEQDYQNTLKTFADATDQLNILNAKLDRLVQKVQAGEYDRLTTPEKAAAYARVKVYVDNYTRKLAANLKAATAHAQQAKSNAFQAMVLAGVIFKYLFGRKKPDGNANAPTSES